MCCELNMESPYEAVVTLSLRVWVRTVKAIAGSKRAQRNCNIATENAQHSPSMMQWLRLMKLRIALQGMRGYVWEQN